MLRTPLFANSLIFFRIFFGSEAFAALTFLKKRPVNFARKKAVKQGEKCTLEPPQQPVKPACRP